MNIKWDITYKCNLNCSHCVNGNLLGNIKDELDINEIRCIIEKLSKLNIVDYVHLLGGEPTARKDFLEIFKAFSDNKLCFGFNTNGIAINNNIINNLVENNYLTNVVFSLEGHTAKVNDSVRGKNVFEITTKNLKALIKAKKEHKRDGLRITINTVFSKKNKDYLNDMLDFCLNLGVDEFVLLQYLTEGSAKKDNAGVSFMDELEAVRVIANRYEELKERLNIVPRFVFPTAKLYVEKVLKKEFPKVKHMCGAGTSFAFLNNEGSLFPCDRYTESILSSYNKDDINLARGDFWGIFSQAGYEIPYQLTEGKYSYLNMQPCNVCPFLKKDCYPCPARISRNKPFIVSHCAEFLKLVDEV